MAKKTVKKTKKVKDELFGTGEISILPEEQSQQVELGKPGWVDDVIWNKFDSVKRQRLCNGDSLAKIYA